jgi:hypothetical protein
VAEQRVRLKKRIELLREAGQSPAAIIAKYPYLCSDVDRHGDVRVYFRRAGQRKVRIRETLDSETFRRRYDELLAGGAKTHEASTPVTAVPKNNTLRWRCGILRLARLQASRCAHPVTRGAGFWS